MSFADFHAGHVRLTILRLLVEAPGYAANDSVLAQLVNAMGLTSTRDQVRGHLAWLEEQLLVTRAKPAEGIVVATITERGNEVAAGRAIVDGVQRPSPGA